MHLSEVHDNGIATFNRCLVNQIVLTKEDERQTIGYLVKEMAIKAR